MEGSRRSIIHSLLHFLFAELMLSAGCVTLSKATPPFPMTIAPTSWDSLSTVWTFPNC